MKSERYGGNGSARVLRRSALAARTPRGSFAAAYDVFTPAACVTHQQNKHFHRFQSGRVIGPTVNNDAFHHKDLPRFQRVFHCFQYPPNTSFRRSPRSSSNSAMRLRVPGAFASLLAQERDTLSCRATAAILRCPASRFAALDFDDPDAEVIAIPPLRDYGTPHIR
jgi:hypothetical protein